MLFSNIIHELSQFPSVLATVNADEVFHKGLNREAGALQIIECVFLPPYQDECPNSECKDAGPGKRTLEKRPAICRYLYNLDGVKSICHHTTYYWKTSYRASYFSNKNRPHTYYLDTEQKDAGCIQVNMHYFMTLRLLEYFNHTQSLAHVSIYNLLTLYNSCHNISEEASNHFTTKTFKPNLSDHCCTTAMDQFNLRKRMMSILNSGGSRPCFREAKMTVLTWAELEGSPYIDHMCSDCTEIYEDPDVPGGGLAICAIAMDGITIGHPRCSATKEQLISINPLDTNPPPCTVMLETPKDRYCPIHTPLLGKLCHAQPCTRNAIGNTKACDLPNHQEAILIQSEKKPCSLAALAFNQQTGAKFPEDPTTALNADTNNFNVDALSEQDESDCTHKSRRDGEETLQPAGKKPFCSNAKMHNNMLFVGTCGITLARETMYCAESVILVWVRNIRTKISCATTSPILR
ncbi:hypothetical protein DFH28DRAFT_1084999 [Melampsora americana]|nr:hypothetical protein DFH28DRAFT_1084999 [Melampsora americana]